MNNIVFGTLKTPEVIEWEGDDIKEPQPIQGWQYRSIWSYLRLQYGRSIDKVIKDAMQVRADELNVKVRKLSRPERKKVLWKLFVDRVNAEKDPRKLQFILDDSNEVRAVASLKHLLIPPEEVYDAAQQIMKEEYGKPEYNDHSELQGIIYPMGYQEGMTMGVQVYAGTINTRMAVRVSNMFRVNECFNPLSWLGSSGFRRFGIGRGHERILRIKVKSELLPRLKEAIKAAMGNQKVLMKKIGYSKKKEISEEDAAVLVAAMGTSYSLGVSTLEQILEQFKKEEKTQWGLAMAVSWVANHGSFKETREGLMRVVEQNTSSVAAAMLVLKDVEHAEKESLQYLESHIEKGKMKSLEHLLKENLSMEYLKKHIKKGSLKTLEELLKEVQQ